MVCRPFGSYFAHPLKKKLLSEISASILPAEDFAQRQIEVIECSGAITCEG